jgi:hypothetical protein
VKRIDHVVLAVRDLDASAERLWRDHGLASLPGGRHPAWGTANRIVPLGPDYVELLAVVDESTALGSRLGRTIRELSAGGDRWFSVCLADDEIDDTARRLGIAVAPGSRSLPDGAVIRWRGAGIDEDRELSMPFFIAWDGPQERHPGRMRVEHRLPVTGIAWVEVAGDAERLDAWIGGDDLPFRVADGDPGVRAVAIGRAGGDPLVLR